MTDQKIVLIVVGAISLALAGTAHALPQVTAGRASGCEVRYKQTKTVDGQSYDVGDLFCWGDNSHGQLGLGDTSPRTTATLVSSLGQNVVEVRTGDDGDTTCASAIVTVGSVNSAKLYCWGQNEQGQVGDGSTMERHSPVLVSGQTAANLPRPLHFDTSGHHTCALFVTSGSAPNYNLGLKCWGDDMHGELGNGFTSSTGYSTPQVVSGETTNMQDVDVGGYSTCSVKSPSVGVREVHCWGINDWGQLGVGGNYSDKLSEGSPTYTGYAIGSISIGRRHACMGAKPTSTVEWGQYCWGDNTYGQLGDGTFNPHNTPLFVMYPVGGGALWGPWMIVGAYHSCSIGIDPSESGLFCWGRGDSGQLGNVSSRCYLLGVSNCYRNRPTGVPATGGGFLQISNGSSFSAGAATTLITGLTGSPNPAQPFATGSNATYQGGNGSTTMTWTFSPVVNAGGW